MAMSSDDFWPQPDFTWANGVLQILSIQPRVHRGDQQIDSTAPAAASGGDLADIISGAATSQAAFDTAMSAKWPNWWGTYSSQFSALGRAVIRRIAAV